MTHLIARIHRGLLLLNASLAGLSLILIFVLVTANAFGRYTLGISIIWGEDTAIYLMVYGLMFGMAWGYLQDKHVGFDLIKRFMPERWLHWQQILTDIIVLIVGIGLIISANEFIATRGGRTSSSTGLPMWVFQTSILLGGILLSLSSVVMAVRRLTGTPDEEAES